MKSFLLVAILAISCALAKDVTSVEVRPMTCYQSCTGFADYLKAKKVDNPVEEAKKFCADAKIQCDDVIRFATFVNTYVQAGLSVKPVCRSKKFCSKPTHTNSGALCTGCKSIVGMISFLVKTANETETEVIEDVTHLCKLFSPLEIQAKVCKDVLTYIHKIIQMVLEGLKPGDICIKLKLCNSTIGMQHSEIVKQITEVIPFISRKVIEAQNDLPYVMNRLSKMEKKPTNFRGSRTCDICKSVVNIVTYAMQFTNSTMKTIDETIKSFCSLKPELQKIECLDLLEKANEIAQYIEQKLSPADACKMLRICPGRTSFALQPAKWALTIGNKMAKKDSKVSCSICKTVVDIVTYSMRFTNSTIESIEESIRMFCNMKPEIEKKMCLMYVSRMDEIVQYVEQKLLPGEVCVKLGFCTKTREGMRYTSLRRPSRKYQRRLKSVCRACSRYEKFIEEHLKVYKSNSQKIRGLIAANCVDWASSAMEEKCLMIAPVLVTTDGIADKLLDKSICKKNLCSEAFMISSSIIYKKKSDACDICKYALGSLLKKFESYRQALKGHFTKSGNFCDNSNFKELSEECKLFVNRTETLFEDVYKQIESAEVCSKMKLCRQKPMFSFEQLLGSLSGDSKACGVCKSIVEATRKGTSAIGGSKSLSTTCQGLKSSVGNMVCNRILGSAGVLADQKAASKSPEEVCKQFQLCGSGDSIGGIISGVFKGLQNILG